MEMLERIRKEREAQLNTYGWTAEHDDTHVDGELAMAAALYATPEPMFVMRRNADNLCFEDAWPFDDADKRSRGLDNELLPARKINYHKRMQDLVQAGALIVAELERLQRRLKHMEELYKPQ